MYIYFIKSKHVFLLWGLIINGVLQYDIDNIKYMEKLLWGIVIVIVAFSFGFVLEKQRTKLVSSENIGKNKIILANEAEDKGYLDIRMYGAVGDNKSDDTNAIQSAIDEASTQQRSVYIPYGTYRITEAVKIKTNVRIFGNGPTFSTVIAPDQCETFHIDGSNIKGGWDFRISLENFTINGTNAVGDSVIFVKNSYNVHFNNLFIFNFATTNGINITSSNHIVGDGLIIYGQEKSEKGSCIRIGENSDVHLGSPDLESKNTGIFIDYNGRLDVWSPRIERCNNGVSCSSTMGINIIGGEIFLQNNFSKGVEILQCSNITIVGTSFDTRSGGIGIDLKNASMGLTNINIIGIPKEKIFDPLLIIRK